MKERIGRCREWFQEAFSVSEDEQRDGVGQRQERWLMVAYLKINRSAPAGHSSGDQRKLTLQVN